MKHAKHIRAAALAAAATLALSACSVLESDKIDYKSAGKGVSLEVPPDLTQLTDASRYAAPSPSWRACDRLSSLPAIAKS